MRFAHLAQRLFNVPLAIHPAKAEIIMAALADRLGIASITRINADQIDFEANAQGFGSASDNGRVGYEVVAGVALIDVEGTLVQKLGSLRPWSGMTGYDGIRQNFLTALDDPEVKAIAFDISSPGGEVSGCFDLVDTIYNARGTKPVWAILDDCSYSAAYAIASATDYITVPRTGGTGSVGVIWAHVDWSEALSKAGFKVTFITYGDTKADGHPELPLSKEARDRFQADITTMGELFVDTVARNRGISTKDVKNTQAKTFLGADGVDIGFADIVLAPDAAFRALLESIA